MPLKKLFFMILLSISMTTAWAHDVWLVPGEDHDLQLGFGHPGSLEPYDHGIWTAGAEIEMLGVFDLFFTDSDGKVTLPLPDQDSHSTSWQRTASRSVMIPTPTSADCRPI